MNLLSNASYSNPSISRLSQPKFQASSGGGFRLEHHDLYTASHDLSYATGAKALADQNFQRAEAKFNNQLNGKDLHNHDIRVGVGRVIEHLKNEFGNEGVIARIQERIDQACR